MTDDDLIRLHIARWRHETPDQARLRDFGVQMWALAGCVRCYPDGHDPIDAMMTDYLIPRNAARAAWAYITRHRRFIDARLTLMEDFEGDGL